MLDRILVPLDGSPLAASILPAAVQLACGLNAPVTLLQIVPTGHLRLHHVADREDVLDQVVTHESEMARAHLVEKEADLAAQGVKVVTDVQVMDRVAEGLVAYARAHDIALIAMSTHGRTGRTRWTLGSVADRVLHTTALPLLLLRPVADVATTPFRHILLPLDQSAVAERALPYAEQLARRLALPLTLVYVQAPYPPSLAEFERAWEVELEEERAAAAYLDQQARALHDRGIRLEASLRHGHPAHRIVDAAREEPGTLIVMGSHGYSGFEPDLLGSVAGAVVRESAVPVLLIRTGGSGAVPT